MDNIEEHFKDCIANDWDFPSWDEFILNEENISFSKPGIGNLIRNIIDKTRNDEKEKITKKINDAILGDKE